MKKRILFVDDESNILQGLNRKLMQRLKHMLSLLLGAVIFLPLATTTYAEDRIYKIGIVPQFEARRLHQIWGPIINELEQRTGLQFKIQGSPTITAFEDEFMSGAFDFSYMNPHQVMLASDTVGYIPLIRDVGRALHGVLVVRKDSGIQKVKDLNSKRVAFPAPNALGASLLVRKELADKFHIKVKPRFVKTHDSVYLNVALRQAAAGGGVQNTLSRQRPDIRSVLKVIHRTTTVPPHPFAAHPRVPAEVRETVRKALLAIGGTDAGRQMLAEIPIRKIGAASITDYTPLEEMGLDRFYMSSD